MLSYIKNSIKVKILLFLFLGSTTIAILFALYNYNVSKKYFIDKLEHSTDVYVDRLSQNLIVPLWEVDSDWVVKIIDTELQEEELIAVSVSAEGNLYVAREKDASQTIRDFTSFSNEKNVFLERTRPIIHTDGEEIGTVTVYVTREFLDKRLLDEAKGIMTMAIFLLFFLIIALYIALDYFILHPLNKMLLVVNKTSKNDYSEKMEILQHDEIGRLANGFNEMIRNILDKEELMISQSRLAAMGEMISMIAHQWRQPISIIAMGANNMILDIELDDLQAEEVRKQSKVILNQTQHLSKTIDDFRNFFSPNKEKTLVLINDLIEDSLQVIEKSLQNNNIAIKKEFNSNTPVKIYSRELLQVFLNIIKNAKEALLENNIKDAFISIKTDEDEDNVYTIICDNGKGIPKDIIKKVFDPYFSTKSEKNGTGLGLYMSKTIVDKHLDGDIYVKNVAEGGACFTMRIPKGIENQIDGI